MFLDQGKTKKTLFVVFKYQRFLIDWGKSSVEDLLNKSKLNNENSIDKLKFP